MNTLSVLSWGAIGVSAVIIVASLLLNIKRGALRSFIRLLTVAISFFGALIAAVIFRCLPIGLPGRLADALPQIGAFAERSETFSRFLHAAPAAILSPLVFVAVFLVLRLLTWFIYLLIVKCCPIAEGKGIRRLFAIPCALVMAASLLFALWMPIAGYADVATRVGESVTTSEFVSEKTKNRWEDVMQTIGEIRRIPCVAAVGVLGGEDFFDEITAVELDGMRICLWKELPRATEAYLTLSSLERTARAAYGEKEIEQWERLSLLSRISEPCCRVLAEVLSLPSEHLPEDLDARIDLMTILCRYDAVPAFASEDPLAIGEFLSDEELVWKLSMAANRREDTREYMARMIRDGIVYLGSLTEGGAELPPMTEKEKIVAVTRETTDWPELTRVCASFFGEMRKTIAALSREELTEKVNAFRETLGTMGDGGVWAAEQLRALLPAEP